MKKIEREREENRKKIRKKREGDRRRKRKRKAEQREEGRLKEEEGKLRMKNKGWNRNDREEEGSMKTRMAAHSIIVFVFITAFILPVEGHWLMKLYCFLSTCNLEHCIEKNNWEIKIYEI